MAQNASLTLSANVSAATPAGGTHSYCWSTTQGGTCLGTTSTYTPSTATAGSTTTYYLRDTYTSPTGCTDQKEQNISITIKSAAIGPSKSFAVGEDSFVYFSKGNLQYQASTGRFKFASSQDTYLGNSTGNTANQVARMSQTNWIDLFAWGTSGWNNGNGFTNTVKINSTSTSNYNFQTYQPWHILYSTDYGAVYGPKMNYSTRYSLVSTSDCSDCEKADWGIYNKIYTNDALTRSDPAGKWRTLTKDEWLYLLNERTGATSKRKYAQVGSTYGLILMPDDWTGASIPTTMAGIESVGGAFLPSAGYAKVGTSVSRNNEITEKTPAYTNTNKSTGGGYYWTSTMGDQSARNAYYINTWSPSTSLETDRFYLYAVRLVKTAVEGDNDEGVAECPSSITGSISGSVSNKKGTFSITPSADQGDPTFYYTWEYGMLSNSNCSTGSWGTASVSNAVSSGTSSSATVTMSSNGYRPVHVTVTANQSGCPSISQTFCERYYF